jgi:hypothetical protein
MQDLFRDYADPSEPPMRLRPETMLATAKRSRRMRLAGGVGALSAAVLAGTMMLVPILSDHSRQERAPSADSARELDIAAAKANGDIPALMQDVVERWAANPGALTLQEIHPSDWTRSDELPANSPTGPTDWHGTWQLADGSLLRVSLMYLSPAWPGPEPCDPGNCQALVAGGQTVHSHTYNAGSTSTLTARHHRSGNFEVLVRVTSTTGTFAYTGQQLAALAVDADLTFPFPTATPTGTPLS